MLSGSIHAGKGSASVTPRFTAKAITPASSKIADTGSRFHATGAAPPYASGSLATRSAHPAVSSTRAASISGLLQSSRLFTNEGRMRGPSAKIRVARNPTVNACREAPVQPRESPAHASRAVTTSHPNAARTNHGYCRATPRVLALDPLGGRSKIPSDQHAASTAVHTAHMAQIGRAHV